MSPPKRPPPKKGRTAVPPRTGRGFEKGRPAPNRGQPARSRQSAGRVRRRNQWIAAVSVVAVVAVVAVFIIVKLTASTPGGAARQPAPAALAPKLASIPIATVAHAAATVSGLQPLQPVNGPPLTAGGKPEMLYIGAEFCPFCAAERWAMLVALSHFGTFANLSETHSAVGDGDIATISFFGSTYTSPYLTFVPVEITTNQLSGNHYKPLETPTAAEVAIWKKYLPNQTIPFVDIGGKWVFETAQYPIQVLEGHSFTDIVNSIEAGNNTIGEDVDAAAAALTKAICTLSGQQPAPTCQAVAGVAAPPAASTPGAASPSQ